VTRIIAASLDRRLVQRELQIGMRAFRGEIASDLDVIRLIFAARTMCIDKDFGEQKRRGKTALPISVRNERLGGPCDRSGLRNLKERAKQRVLVRKESA